MYDFHPYFTKDGSVGLYSPEFNDIYHSATGALTEACEKFILPSNIDYLLESKTEIKVLDICYGIGYNTKSFLNYILEKFYKYKFNHANYYAQIHTDNQTTKNIRNYVSIYTDKNSSTTHTPNETIYTYNDFPKISVTAIDNDEKLIFLSPFIKTGEKNYHKYNTEIPNEKIHKYLDCAGHSRIMKIDNLISYLILNKIINNFPEIMKDEDISGLVSSKERAPFFERNIKGIYQLYKKNEGSSTPFERLKTFLHNIYYQHVSTSYKRALKAYLLQDINLNFKIDDARKIIIKDEDKYNLIFLDAFTPSKCPCLWTYEFFKELFNHLEPDGMLLTYSSSASVRSAMVEAGFSIGNIYCERENKFIGTIAVKDKSLIKYELSEYDLGLLKTRAGIFYRDPNLTGQNEAIIAARNSEVKNSTRQSTSQYRREHESSSLSSHLLFPSSLGRSVG